MKTKMTNLEKVKLEDLVRQSLKVRQDLAKILIRNYDTDAELADIIALDAVNQAIGTDRLEELKKQKAQEAKRRQREQKWYKFQEAFWEWGVVVLIGFVFVVVFLGVLSIPIYNYATTPTYPRVYQPIEQNVRFSTATQTSFMDGTVEGLSPLSNLCVRGYVTSRDDLKNSNSKTCIHLNKVESLNQALDKAVAEDFNGVVWNEPNGKGEVWTVERNNYRFVITANEDTNYKK